MRQKQEDMENNTTPEQEPRRDFDEDASFESYDNNKNWADEVSENQ